MPAALQTAKEGSLILHPLTGRYLLESGTVVHIYRHRKTRVDEVMPEEMGAGGGDIGGPGPSQEGLDQLARNLLRVRSGGVVCFHLASQCLQTHFTVLMSVIV
jgi:hypothetical protein